MCFVSDRLWPPGASSMEAAARSKVGVVHLAELEVTVRPKIAMNRLIFLMGYARNPKHWREPFGAAWRRDPSGAGWAGSDAVAAMLRYQ